jgi:DNA polymerase I-like protein with 3'-5' exonuclease and polymerase domains
MKSKLVKNDYIQKMSRYCVLDIEVDAKMYRKRFCDPFEKKNKITMLQRKDKNKEAKVIYNEEGISRDKELNLHDVDIIVGHNIKFDMSYLWENDSIRKFIRNGGVLWDTMITEFLLEGQNKTLRYSLDALAVKYGGTVKDTTIKSTLKRGYSFNDIPSEIAIKYGVEDVINTEKLYIGQLEKVYNANMEKVIEIYMKHLLSVIEMECRGLYIDKIRLNENWKKQQFIVDKLLDRINHHVEDYWPKDFVDFDVNSVQHISSLLFGGTLKAIKSVVNPTASGVLYYKSGKKAGELRTKEAKVEKKIKGLSLTSRWTEESKNQGYYKTDNKTLENYDNELVKLLLEYRRENKLLTTYYYGEKHETGFIPLINPYTGCIHSEFNMKGTATGRLASRNPNVQNLHPSMLEIFSSRFGEDGVIIELDWSQLEVGAAALIFQEDLLKVELLNGLDIHLENAKRLYDREEITKKERKIAKAMTFGLLYGQSAKSMSKIHNIEEDLAKKFIEQFYDKYTNIQLEHSKLILEIEKNIFMIDKNTRGSYIEGFLGKKYFLREYTNEWGKRFNPSEYKNYKIQGTAATIMSRASYIAYKYLSNYAHLGCIVNEVHDSLIIDCKSELISYIKDKVKRIIEEEIAILTGTELFKLDMSVGKTWYGAKNE